MRTIIAGSRGCTDMGELLAAIADCGWFPTTVISGTARGADRLGEIWANEERVPCERFPPDWGRHGKSAGYKRNEKMADNAEALIALWDGASVGTRHMIDIAQRKGLKVHVRVVVNSTLTTDQLRSNQP